MRRHLWGRAVLAVLVLTLLAAACTAARGATRAAEPATGGGTRHAPQATPSVTASATPAPAPVTPAPEQSPAAAQPAPRQASEPDAAKPPPRLRQRRAADPSAQPAVATGPRRLARQILAAERTIRSDGVTKSQAAVAGHTLQLAYRELSLRPRWDATVLGELPHGLRPIARANLRAYRELGSMSGSKPPKTLPSWRIVEPPPRRQLERHYRKAERIFGVPWEYLAAINLVETRMGRIRGTSTAGAQGPMQFIPPTWKLYGNGDVNDPHDAIMAAARYLKARGAPRDMGRALYSYNNDVRYVRAVAAHAEVMRRDPRALVGYYHWQVYYRQKGGPVWLHVGYDGRR